jgi:L-phenylalanine/L-methionine N-acetyltransferase
VPNDYGVVIRAMEISDIDDIQALYSQSSVAAMTLQVPFQSRTEIETRLAPNPDLRRLVAEIHGEVVGDAGLMLYRGRRKHAGSIGMAVREEYQGKGIGAALLAAILELADNWYDLRRVELEVYVDNLPAIRLYERHGFAIEGTHRAYAFRLGEFVDTFSMARLKLPGEPFAMVERGA